MADFPQQAQLVLCCDGCGVAFDGLSEAEIFWAQDDPAKPVEYLELRHRARCNPPRPRSSTALLEFATPETALRGLARRADVPWTSEQARRLMLIAWAAAQVATKEEQNAARARAERL